ncbi:MAG: hypothetical protein KJI71_02825 [Patescibacteria group bacterium]|nr:hypothetical protein [Patescibacteria group bacterium]
MRKFLVILIFIVLVISFGIYFWRANNMSEEVSGDRLKDLSSIILENTKFKDFNINRFYFQHPNWQEIEIDPELIWPKEIAAKQEILLYLTNPDGVKIVATKKEVDPEYFKKPYPLIFREISTRELQILEEEGRLTDWLIIKEQFFENGILIESKMVIFGTTIASIQKSIIVNENNSRFIYSVGISGRDRTFEDYRSLAEYITDSMRYY